MDALADIEKRLARFVGPIARVMVRRGADQTRDVGELVRRLAEKISDPVDRQNFCAGAAGVVMPAKAPAADDRTVTGRPSAAPAPDPLTVEEVAAASRLLTTLMGPIAPILVKRAAATAGISRQQFITTLAAHLSDESDRLAFVKSLAVPVIARPRA
jgi:serine/threonine-protein kinase